MIDRYYFWRPKYKYELVKWLKNRYPKYSISKFKNMNKKQLYAIYFSIRRV